MNKYIKKPVVIEALQWDGSWESKELIEKEFPGITVGFYSHPPSRTIYSWYVKLHEENYKMSTGDFIIKGVTATGFPCGARDFEMTYDKVD